jgi:hypothetical protein
LKCEPKEEPFELVLLRIRLLEIGTALNRLYLQVCVREKKAHYNDKQKLSTIPYTYKAFE